MSLIGFLCDSLTPKFIQGGFLWALREKMIAEMKLRNFAARTQKSYLAVMVDLAKHYRQFPDQLTQEQIRTYLLHLQERGCQAVHRT
jgi:Phage integrase, N-terminal SAM-like domain